ncbi:unnamed protein product [Closterium sp. NIES-53]
MATLSGVAGESFAENRFAEALGHDPLQNRTAGNGISGTEWHSSSIAQAQQQLHQHQQQLLQEHQHLRQQQQQQHVRIPEAMPGTGMGNEEALLIDLRGLKERSNRSATSVADFRRQHMVRFLRDATDLAQQPAQPPEGGVAQGECSSAQERAQGAQEKAQGAEQDRGRTGDQGAGGWGTGFASNIPGASGHAEAEAGGRSREVAAGGSDSHGETSGGGQRGAEAWAAQAGNEGNAGHRGADAVGRGGIPAAGTPVSPRGRSAGGGGGGEARPGGASASGEPGRRGGSGSGSGVDARMEVSAYANSMSVLREATGVGGGMAWGEGLGAGASGRSGGLRGIGAREEGAQGRDGLNAQENSQGLVSPRGGREHPDHRQAVAGYSNEHGGMMPRVSGYSQPQQQQQVQAQQQQQQQQVMGVKGESQRQHVGQSLSFDAQERLYYQQQQQQQQYQQQQQQYQSPLQQQQQQAQPKSAHFPSSATPTFPHRTTLDPHPHRSSQPFSLTFLTSLFRRDPLRTRSSRRSRHAASHGEGGPPSEAEQIPVPPLDKILNVPRSVASDTAAPAAGIGSSSTPQTPSFPGDNPPLGATFPFNRAYHSSALPSPAQPSPSSADPHSLWFSSPYESVGARIAETEAAETLGRGLVGGSGRLWGGGMPGGGEGRESAKAETVGCVRPMMPRWVTPPRRLWAGRGGGEVAGTGGGGGVGGGGGGRGAQGEQERGRVNHAGNGQFQEVRAGVGGIGVRLI